MPQDMPMKNQTNDSQNHVWLRAPLYTTHKKRAKPLETRKQLRRMFIGFFAVNYEFQHKLACCMSSHALWAHNALVFMSSAGRELARSGDEYEAGGVLICATIAFLTKCDGVDMHVTGKQSTDTGQTLKSSLIDKENHSNERFYSSGKFSMRRFW